jgi:diguanylate cyclase (GGDEF)-like protein/PAS domain S-box-containing protein
VIDDTQRNLEVMGQLLSLHDFQVTVANHGERGIAIARKTTPHVILLDVMMPDIDGYEVCKRLKEDEKTADIPVIFLTAKAEQEDLLKGFAVGAVDYVTKPFIKEELLARVNTHAELSRKRSQEQMLSSILDKYVLEIIIDIEGKIEYASNAFLELTQFTADDLIEKSFDMLKHPESFRSDLGQILESVKNNYIYYKEISIKTNNNQKCILNMFVEPICGANEEVTGAQCFMTDITSKKELEHLSITDKLTNLNNRQKLDEVLKYEHTQASRYGSIYSVILLDIDDFKQINDSYGHLVGDNVLIKLAAILQKEIRDSDTVGRWGGEEFLLIITKATEEEAELVSEKLRKVIEDTNFDVGRPVTVSLGVGCSKDEDNLTSLLSKTDKALYSAKKAGKNKTVKCSDIQG